MHDRRRSTSGRESFLEDVPSYGGFAERVEGAARIMRDKFAFSVSVLVVLDSAFISGGKRDIDVGRSIVSEKFTWKLSVKDAARELIMRVYRLACVRSCS